MEQNFTNTQNEGFESVVEINRISKKTKGGNQMRFSALVVVGDKKGKVGSAIAKAKDVRSAIQKSLSYAKKNMVEVPLKGTTIPYEINAKYNAAKILLKPAPAGSGIIAGGAMRVVLEAVGVHDCVGKILGTNNKVTNIRATIKALNNLNRIKARKSK